LGETVDDEQKKPSDPVKKLNAPSRLFRWLDKRTGVHELMKESLDEPIPGGARLAYVFGSGLLFIFISQIITGICLAIYYVPSAETAHTSVAYITKQVAAGAFLRSLHYYGSSAMIIVLALHFLQTFLYGSFKGRRELLWISGAVLSFLVLGMGFTGYLLPWDQKAYFATAVGTNIVGQIPLIGNWLTRLLRGGDTIGTLTLSRFYVAHVFLLPAGIFAFIAAHIFLFRKAGPAGPINEDPVEPKLAPEGFYPRQVLMDMAFALLIMVGLGFLSYFHPASLGPIANPADTQFLPRPEWYYLSMFEWLKFWEGPKVVFAVVVVPGLLAMAFFLLPFLDRSLERRPWRRPIPVLAVAFVVLGMVYLGMKSHTDDRRDPTAAAQLDVQDQQEQAYGKAPFSPYVESPGMVAPVTVASGGGDPLVAHGKGIYASNGCSGCHGETGMGTPAAPALVGVTTKYPDPQLVTLLHNPDAKMRAGNMPAVDVSPKDMSALVAYLGVLGTTAANVAPEFNAAPAVEVLASTRSGGSGPVVAHASLNPAVLAGQELFQSHGCFACHGQAGVGGRAPALAPAVARLSDAQLTTLLQSPNAKMKAGGMAPLAGTPRQMASMVAYLRTLGAPPASTQPASGPSSTQPQEEAAASAAPATAAPAALSSSTGEPSGPTSVPVQNVALSTRSSAGAGLFVAQGCAACHGPTAEGTHFAPSLINVASKFPGDKLPNLLRHPTNAMRSGGMPALTVSDAQLHQLVEYLSGLNSAAASSARTATATGQPQPAGASRGATAETASAAAPVLVPMSVEELAGQKVFQRNACETCHGEGGRRGTVAAPGLAGTASILPASVLENLLRHHSTQMQKGGMPLTNMNARDMRALVAYVRAMPLTGGK
jgi:ubiquinol-cytochrome c reductase cytochrome b subunit